MQKTIWPLKTWLKIVKLALALASFAILLVPFAARGQQAGKQSGGKLTDLQTRLQAEFMLKQAGKQSGGKSTPEAPATVAPPPVKKPVDYNRFTHQTHLGLIKVPNTNFARDLKCESCHERPTAREISNNIVATTDRNVQLSLKFPGHKACVECHVVQFTSKPQQTCVICHNTQQGLNARPPQRDFPLRYDFNAFFDAKQHELHVTYKKSDGKQMDCDSCHVPTQRGLAVTIGSHPECYVCHAPGSFDQKAKMKGDCAACHTQRLVDAQPEPFDAKLASRAYGAKFSHVEHMKFMDCRACHSIQGGYNQNSPSSPTVKQHNTTVQAGGRGCFTCHDGRQHYGRSVFSGDDAQSCGRCHNLKGDIKVPRVRG